MATNYPTPAIALTDYEYDTLAALFQCTYADTWASPLLVTRTRQSRRGSTPRLLHMLWYRDLVEEDCRITATGRISKYYRISRAGYRWLIAHINQGR